MGKVRSFHRYRGESTFTMAKFVALLREQLPLVVPTQTKYRVTAIPTERTIRFYTAGGLVDKPVGRDGANALYGYRQLLQIMAIKFLQSQYIPLVKIKSLVHSVSNRELELLIPESITETATHRGLIRSDRPPVDKTLIRPVEKISYKQGGAAAPVDKDAGEPGHHDSWHRIEVSPGIELHVHAAALSEENRERLRGVLLREIGVLRGWFGEEKH